MEKLENKIRVERAKKNITQAELGDIVGISRQAIFAIEHGGVSPRITICIKMAIYFGVPVDYLFNLKNE